MSKKKSKRKIIIIAAISIVVLLLAAGGSVFLIMNNEMKEMEALDNGEIISGIFAVRSGISNIFLLKSAEGYIAIDAGVNEAQAKEGLSQLGITSDIVSAVLLTHSHNDHIGALNLFDKATVYAAKSSIADIIISDGKFFEVDGIGVQVISAPGHADDSVCFLIDGKYLFVGDNLSLKNGVVGLFNSIFNKSDEQQKTDIQKLAGLRGVEYVFTAHYGFTDNAVFP